MSSVIKSRQYDLSFHKNGTVNVKASVSELLNLKVGDAINLFEDRHEIYLYKQSSATYGRNFRGVCRKVNNGSRFFRVNCKELTDYILKKTDTDHAKLYVGEPVELNGIGRAVPIIIKSNMRHG